MPGWIVELQPKPPRDVFASRWRAKVAIAPATGRLHRDKPGLIQQRLALEGQPCGDRSVHNT